VKVLWIDPPSPWPLPSIYNIDTILNYIHITSVETRSELLTWMAHLTIWSSGLGQPDPSRIWLLKWKLALITVLWQKLVNCINYRAIFRLPYSIKCWNFNHGRVCVLCGWNHSTRAFERKNFGKLSVFNYYLDDKTLANWWTITKFANVFPCQRFMLYSI